MWHIASHRYIVHAFLIQTAKNQSPNWLLKLNCIKLNIYSNLILLRQSLNCLYCSYATVFRLYLTGEFNDIAYPEYIYKAPNYLKSMKK